MPSCSAFQRIVSFPIVQRGFVDARMWISRPCGQGRVRRAHKLGLTCSRHSRKGVPLSFHTNENGSLSVLLTSIATDGWRDAIASASAQSAGRSLVQWPTAMAVTFVSDEIASAS